MVTIKQKKTMKKLVENHGNISKSMREAGYSKNTAKNPKNLTDSLGWDGLMEKYLPDKDLAKKHKELLNKKETIARNNIKTGKIEVKRTGEIDAQAVGKGLDLAYKLKNKFVPTLIKFVDDNETLTDEEIEAEVNKRNLNR